MLHSHRLTPALLPPGRHLLLAAMLIIPGLFTTLRAQLRGVDSNFIYLADPAVFFDRKIYYLYGTGSPDGFPVWVSRDLKKWTQPGLDSGRFALRKGQAFGTAQFWAPQVFALQNRYFMAYAANEHIAIAQAKTPAGPFTQTSQVSLEAPVKQIDPFVFVDEDGKKYLYHVRLTNGNRIFVAELNNDLSAIKPETLRECISATEPWENTAAASWPVAEGPSVIRHNGFYYLFYSANDFRNPDYAVGYAVASSPYGPWKKWSGNPIISRSLLKWNGTGHGDFVNGTGNERWYVFHTHYSDTVVSPRKTALISLRFVGDAHGGPDTIQVNARTFYFLKPSR